MRDFNSILAEYPQGLSAAELERLTSVSRSTLNRQIKELVGNGQIISRGNGAAVRYFTSDPLAAISNYINKSVSDRSVASYNEEKLNVSPVLSPDNIKVLTQKNANPLDKRSLAQFLIDFSCASAALEGGSYSLLDSQSLIEYGEINKGKPLEDAYLVLNHKEAFEYLYENQRLDSIFAIHALLTNDHKIPGLLKSRHFLPEHDRGIVREYSDVNIAGSTYLPPFRPGTKYIQKTLELILDRAANLDPVQASFYLLTRLPYLQPFQDGNKRTARAVCNIPLLQAKMPPISFVDFKKQDYIVAMLAFYELGDTRLAEKCFVNAYQKSQQRLLAPRGINTETMTGSHYGKIIAIEGLFAIQKEDHNDKITRHELSKLSKKVIAGEIVDINYQNGIGYVGDQKNTVRAARKPGI